MAWPVGRAHTRTVNIIAFAMNAGLLLMLVVPGVAAVLAKLRRGGVSPARAGRRAAEIESVFEPGHRRQIEQMEISDEMRVDAENGDGDPLDEFPDPDGVRDQLDPEGIYEARRARSLRTDR